ncbi:chemotaxis protein CheA, partial [Rhodopirellula europaea]
MNNEDAELINEFVIESQEHLSDVENQLLSLESQGDSMDIALVNTVFRAVHSIKGAAGFLGLDVLQGLAHREEEILDKLRANELRPTPVVIDTLLKATDRLKGLLADVYTSNEQDITDHLDALERILNGETAAEVASAIPEPIAQVEATQPVANEGLSGEALREFLIESHDNLEQLERDLMSLEEDPTSEMLVNGVFRSIHTIKGTAGFLGFAKLEKLSHVAETLLGDVRAGKLMMGPEIASALLLTVDKVRDLLASIEQTGAESDCESEALAESLTKLHEILLPESTEAPAKSTVTPKAPAKKTTPKKSGRGRTTKTSTKRTARATSTKAATPRKTTKPKAKAEPAPPAHAKSSDCSTEATTPVSKATDTAPPPSQPISVSPAAAKPNVAHPDTSAAESTIRVDVALLENLMTCVGELVLARNQIMQFANDHADPIFQKTSQRLNLITSELQESVMKTRMQPIGNVWSKFPRLVRDLAGICNKQVRIEMEGKDTELDKTIIEAIKDPLTHIVRNTVDHGIENAETRRKNGKPDEGCLTLRAYHEGGQVNIEISDDGGGINPELIKAKALEKGLLNQDQLSKLCDRDVGNLIFLPGFSTAAKVSNVSGRGVGMDVVKTNIEKIGGTVDLQSELGVGTTIKIKIPLTLAIIPALIVTCDNARYAIPQVNLQELLRLDGEALEKNIEWIQSAPVYRLRGRLLPLVDLRDQLNIDKSNDRDAMNIVVLRADDRQF